MKHTSFLSAFANAAGLQRGIICFFGVLLCLNLGYAQVNLVQNPSFEDHTSCPNSLGQMNKSKFWNTPIAGGGSTPDYYHRCSPNNPLSMSSASVPIHTQGEGSNYLEPRNGDAYARFSVYAYYPNGNNNREYIQNVLRTVLVANQSYCYTMYLNLFDFSYFATDEIGAYFDNGTVAPIGNGNINKIPQVKSPSGVTLKDTSGWMKVSGTFVASGNEKYITIGNFRNDANTFTELLYGATLQTGMGAMYYIDDVSVIPSDLPAYAGEDTVISPGDSVFIGRQPEIGLECVWHSNGQQVGIGAGIWVKPTQTTSYIVTQDLCGNIQQDTVIVYVFPTSVQVPLYLQSVQLFPNPAHHMITLSLPQAQGQYFVLQLFSPEGKKVWQGATQSAEMDIPLPAESGVYFLEIRDVATGGRVVKKVVRE